MNQTQQDATPALMTIPPKTKCEEAGAHPMRFVEGDPRGRTVEECRTCGLVMSFDRVNSTVRVLRNSR